MCGSTSVGGGTLPALEMANATGVAGATGGGLIASPPITSPGGDIAAVLAQLTATVTALQQTLTGSLGLPGGGLGAQVASTTAGGGVMQGLANVGQTAPPCPMPGMGAPDKGAPGKTDPVQGAPGQAPPAAPAPTPDQAPPVGQTPPPADVPPGATSYTVKPGDTLSKIAKASGVSVDALYELNAKVIGPDRNRINPGQVLQLPAPGTDVPPAPKPPAPKPPTADPGQDTPVPGGGGTDEVDDANEPEGADGAAEDLANRRIELQGQLDDAKAALAALPTETGRGVPESQLQAMKAQLLTLQQELITAEAALERAANQSPTGATQAGERVIDLKERITDLDGSVRGLEQGKARIAALEAARAEVARLEGELAALPAA